MVGRAYFPGENDEMPTLRRYNSRGGNAYPLSDERELPPSLRHDIYTTSRGQHLPPHESRNSDRRSPENDSATRPRSRIPVACGRCRKRKIKCSGDNGGPCTNCKQAQHDQCQFLRVSSMDAQLKTEAPSYEYDPSAGAGSRLSCRVPFYAPHYVQPSPLGVETGYSYRNNSLSAYPFQQKSYYPATSFAEYGDGGIDYDLQGSTYQLLGTENLGIPSNYNTSGTPRGWNTAPQYHRNSLFIEQSETPYSQGSMPYNGSGFPLRTAINSDSRNTSLSTMSLPAPTPTSVPLTAERLLPIPAAQRQTHVPFHRPTDLGTTVNLGGQSAYQPYQGDYVRSSLKSQNMQAVSENGSLASSYLPMPSSSPESIASSQITYGTQQMSMSQQQNEIYTPSSSDGLYQNESSDSSYGHSNNGSKRGSQSSQMTSPDALLPPIATDTLANGQRYVPYEAPNYPAPPSGAMASNISPGGRVLHHTSVTVDN